MRRRQRETSDDKPQILQVSEPRVPSLPTDFLPEGMTLDDFAVERGSGLALPRESLTVHQHELLRDGQALATQLTSEEIERYATRDEEDKDESEVPFTAIQELAADPAKFILDRIARAWPTAQKYKSTDRRRFQQAPPEYKELAEFLFDGDENYLLGYTETARQRTIVETRTVGETRYQVSKPGILEQMGMEIVTHMLSPKAIEGLNVQEKVNALELILFVFDTYRLQDPPLEYLPEMPDLTASLTNLLSKTPEPRVHQVIYDVLEKLQLPQAHEDILFLMDGYQELSHPLAFQLTTQLMTRKDARHSLWLQSQQERQTQLLHKLMGPAQSMLDHYQELAELSKGLVMTTDPFSPTKGKVGLEMEFRREQDEYSDVNEHDLWPVGWDLLGLPEVRRAKHDLHYGANYLDSLNKLALYLRDNAKAVTSLHIHLDEEVHPRQSTLALLLGSDNEEKKTFRYNGRHKTWEYRGFMIPWDRTPDRIDPSTLAAGIDLLVWESWLDPNIENTPQKLTLNLGQQIPTLGQIAFGHLCSHYADPRIRLAALKALQHQYFMSAVDFSVFDTSYSPETLGELVHFFTQWQHGDKQKSKIWQLVRSNYTHMGEFLVNTVRQGNPEDQGFALEILRDRAELFVDEIRALAGTATKDQERQLILIYLRHPELFETELDELYALNELKEVIVQAWLQNYPKFERKIETAFAEGSHRVKTVIVRHWARFASKFPEKIQILLADENASTRRTLIQELEMSPGTEHIFEDLFYNDPSGHVQLEALSRMAHVPERFHTVLQQAFENQNSNLRLRAVIGFTLAPHRYTEQLRKAFTDPDVRVRKVIFDNLIIEDLVAFKPQIEQVALNDPDSNLRSIAKKYLGYSQFEENSEHRRFSPLRPFSRYFTEDFDDDE